MIKYILMILLIVGCNTQTDYRDVSFIEMEEVSISLVEHIELCKKKPNSIFCKKQETIGDIRPTKKYAIEILNKMNSNFEYKSNDIWIYNNTVYQDLEGDCEDIASTMAKHMVDGGIDKKYLFLVYRKISKTEAHMFLAVDTIDAGILHLDYYGSGYPIEDRINFHMRLDNPGVYKWVKGNIVQINED